MTKEEVKQAIDIMRAYAEGRKLEYYDNIRECWEPCSSPFFDWYHCKYRVKPEPKYRPFKSQEECWNEMHKHPDFGWLYYKEKGYYININAIGDRVGMNGQKFVEAFSDYTFTDGIPFGIKEE